MYEENFESRGFGDDVNIYNSRYSADAGVHARFYTQPVKDEHASAEAGRAIFKELEFVEVITPGNQTNIVRRKATDEDRRRFHRQYHLFSTKAESQVVGTPLSEVAWLTRTQVAELAYLNIRSLEQLANLDDNSCAKFAGLYDLKNRAKAAMASATDMAPFTKLQEENETLKNQVAALTEQMKELLESQKKK